MRNIAFVILFCSVAATTARAQRVPIIDEQIPSASPVLTNIALNAAESARTTKTVSVAGRTQVSVYIEYERGGTGAATHVTLQCFAGRAYAKLGAMIILSDTTTVGTRDSTPHIWRHAVSATTVIRWIITPLDDKLLRCIVGSQGAVTADDVIARIDFRKGVL